MMNIRISEVKMEKTNTGQTAKATHRQVQSSTTLNRRYVKRPEKNAYTKKISDVAVRLKNETTSPKITRFSSSISKPIVKDTADLSPAVAHPTQIIANQKMRNRQQQMRKPQPQKLSAKELKDIAIRKALLSAEKQQPSEQQTKQPQITDHIKKRGKIKFGAGRITLALTCAAAAIFAIVYFVNLNMPDIQFRAAAAQLNAAYPNYLPYNFAPSSISSENDIVTLTFDNNTSGESFTISEEKLSWDSNSLLNNFVKQAYGEDYVVIRERGLTIYVGENQAAWVNGGIVYKLNIVKGSLSKKQIGSIAISF